MPSALVVGGARRIGAAIARMLASKGYDVSITYHTSAEQAATTARQCSDEGVRSMTYHCDVANHAMLAQTVDAVVRDLGVPDVVICNAGVFPSPTAIGDLDIDAIRHTMDVNTLPLVALASSYHRHLTVTPGQHGRLISISSLGAIEIWRDRLAYNMSKSALVTAVQSLARSGAPAMSVNTVAPGAMHIPDDPNGHEHAMTSVDRIPMRRFGTADDVADAVWFFASCSPYITGQFIAVDGGYHLHR